MKLTTLALISLLISLSAYAQLDATEQLNIVEGIAKTERRNLWRAGYRDVDSGVSRVSLEELNQIIKENPDIEEPLDRSQIAALYSCYHRANCSLFLIDVGASMYGGSGHHRLWVLLNPETGKYRFERHQVWVE